MNQESAQKIRYVTKDAERASGKPISPFFDVFTNEPGNHLSTRELLESETFQSLQKQDPAAILVFKPTAQIEAIAQTHGWTLLNPSAALADKVEQKISQIDWLGDLAKFLPPHDVKECKDITFAGTPFILQFNRAHTGSGTFFITSEQELEDATGAFPNRPAKISEFIDGHVFTCNVLATKARIYPGNVSYQITGHEPFTNNPFATIGNDWYAGKFALSAQSHEQIATIAEEVGKKLVSDGWNGLFGIDVMVEKETGRVHLLEINARQPASTSFESELQNFEHSIFEGHLHALLGASVASPKEILDGAQVILRNSPALASCSQNEIKTLQKDIEALGCTTRLYDQSEPGTDKIRIQTREHFFDETLAPTPLFHKLSDLIRNLYGTYSTRA